MAADDVVQAFHLFSPDGVPLATVARKEAHGLANDEDVLAALDQTKELMRSEPKHQAFLGLVRSGATSKTFAYVPENRLRFMLTVGDIEVNEGVVQDLLRRVYQAYVEVLMNPLADPATAGANPAFLRSIQALLEADGGRVKRQPRASPPPMQRGAVGAGPERAGAASAGAGAGGV